MHLTTDLLSPLHLYITTEITNTIDLVTLLPYH